MSIIVGANRRTLQKRAPRHDGWTKAKRIVFLDTFAATCNTRLSARKCGMGDHSVRALIKRDPQFAALYEEALQDGYRRIEAELLARTLGTQLDDENPTDAERGEIEPPQFDPDMAIKVLQIRAAEARARSSPLRGRVVVRATQEETDAALEKKLSAMERRLAKTTP